MKKDAYPSFNVFEETFPDPRHAYGKKGESTKLLKPAPGFLRTLNHLKKAHRGSSGRSRRFGTPHGELRKKEFT